MSVQTAEAPARHDEPLTKQAERGGEVAIIAPPRLAYHPAIADRFGVDKASWKALVEAVWPAAQSSDSIVLALSYCKARKLDPFKRVVHIVPVWDSESRSFIETVWPGIAEHRTTAFRTKQYAGADAAEFGDTVKRTFKDKVKGKEGWKEETVELEFPLWAQITVYRLIDGQRVPMPGPRVYWLETYSRRGRSTLPNERWARAPFQMIEKCAEAAALRRAFPEELGDEPTSDEAGAYAAPGDDARDVTPPAPKPTRATIEAQPEMPEPTASNEIEFIGLDGEVRTFTNLADYRATFALAIAEAAGDEKSLRGLMESNQAQIVAVHTTQPEVAGDIAEAYDAALKAAQAKPRDAA